MLEHLFGSKTRLKLLKIFFRETDRPYYVRELTRILDAQINAVRRELGLLLAAGLVLEADIVEKQADTDVEAGSSLRKYYRLNKESILYPELQALLIKAQVIGEQEFAKEIQDKAGDLKLFILTGRFVNEKRAPSDMLLVGAVDERGIARIIAKYEKDFGFDIRYTVMTTDEFVDRRHIMDKFIYSLFEGEHLKVVNSLGV